MKPTGDCYQAAANYQLDNQHVTFNQHGAEKFIEQYDQIDCYMFCELQTWENAQLANVVDYEAEYDDGAWSFVKVEEAA